MKESRKKGFPFCKVIFALAAVCLVLYLLFVRIPSFADWFNQSVGNVGRQLLSYLTVWLPFSVAELLFLFSPVLLGILIYRIVTVISKSGAATRAFLCRVGAAICLVAILFVLCFAPGYYGKTVEEKLGMERIPVSNEELYQTALLLADQLNSLADGLDTLDSGSTIMPYSIAEMNRKLMDAYDNDSIESAFPARFYSKVKPLLVSKLFSYAHITGVYSFFTGEANINVDFPDYVIPYTAAHELAHQRGVAREDEANFVAFLVCHASDDLYLQYSGYLNLFEYVSNALYTADSSLWLDVWNCLDERIQNEQRAYVAFFDRYRENAIASASGQINNTYLQLQGVEEGTRSYDLVVDLAVAFFRDQLPLSASTN